MKSLNTFISSFLFILASVSTMIKAEEIEENSYITLNEALAYTLENQKDIEISIFNIKAASGVLQQSAGPFDPLLEGQVFHARSHDKECSPQCVNFSPDYYALDSSATKKTRIGTTFALNVHYRHYSAFSRTKEFTFQIVQPLLRNFINGVDRQVEIANRLELQAVQWDTLFVISEKILETITAYMDASAAQESFVALQESVERLEALIRDVNFLVEGNELARNDANQPLATIALIKQQFYQAKFTVYSTKQLLLLAMGEIQESRCSNFEEKIRVAPRMPNFLNIDKSPSEFIDPLVQQAFAMRFDILASETRESENLELVKGAKNNALPQIDVFSQVARHDTRVRAFEAPCTSADFTPSPVFVCRDTEWRFGINFSIPFYNDTALGILKQKEAVFNQSILKTQLLKQTVITNIIDILNFLTSLQDQIRKEQDAVDLYNLLFENEKKKLITGFGSVFELLNFETNRISAQLNLISLRHAYLVNLAKLHHETGSLIIVSDSCGTISFQDFTEFPLLD